MPHRRDLNALTQGERQQLVNLMFQYLTDDIVDDHMNIIHSGLEIFTGHRAYIAGMEAWLSTHGGAAFVPLPLWNSANAIPNEFNVVKPEDDGTARPALTNLNPNIPKPAEFEPPAVCSFEDGAVLGDAINGWHGSVHCSIGGTMCNIMIASAAPIFWCWHAFVDHIYWDWQQCTVPCPSLTGLTVAEAERKLRLSGLKRGNVVRLPRRLFPPERLPVPFPIPLPDPPPPFRVFRPAAGAAPGHAHAGAMPEVDRGFARTSAEFGHHLFARAQGERFRRGPIVAGQTPGEGVAVRLGNAVELTAVTD